MAKLLTVCAGLVYLCGSAYGALHTHVTNHLTVPIHATTSYLGGHSKFKARNILPGGSGMSLQSFEFETPSVRAVLAHFSRKAV